MPKYEAKLTGYFYAQADAAHEEAAKNAIQRRLWQLEDEGFIFDNMEFERVERIEGAEGEEDDGLDTFCVTLRREMYGSVHVRAKDAAEAESLAEDMADSADDDFWMDESGIEIAGCEKEE